MIRNFLIIFFRQIASNKLFMLIKIFCLSVGMAVALLMMLYVFHEYSFDNFHQNKDSIYQMIVTSRQGDLSNKSSISTAGIGPSLLAEFPEVSKMTRLSVSSDAFFVLDDQLLMVDKISFADAAIFDIFSFKLRTGNPDLALSDPFTMVISTQMAQQFFGDINPVGKVLKYQDKYNFKISGIVDPPPFNSHIQFDALLSFSSLERMDGYFLGWDGGWSYYTYVMGSQELISESFQKKLSPFLEKHINYKYRNYGAELSLGFDALENVYLHSSAPDSQPVSGNTSNLFVFIAIAFFILLIACINFINLSTAQFSQRTKETGMKKVLGASRQTLALQFLSETMLLSILSLLLAVIMVELLLPGFSKLFRTNISLYESSFLRIFILFMGTGIFTGLLAGSYPAIFLSGFSPLRILKGGIFSRSTGKTFRNTLVVFQFLLASGLIICTLTVFRQISYINHKDLGYDKENYLILNLSGEKSMKDYKLLKNKLRTLPYVSSAGSSTGIPGLGFTRNGYIPEGVSESMILNVLDVDEDYLSTLGIQLTSGKGFDESSKASGEILINQALANQLGWQDPLGKTIKRNGEHTIIGVVRDFHFAPLHHAIAPLIITQTPWEGYQEGFDFISFRLATSDNGKVISDVEKIWKDLFPAEPFIFHFMDQMLESEYANEKNFGRIFTWAAILAVLIASLGLFGLTTFITQQRRKEIGIRKTFGANAARIVWLLGKQFISLVVLGNLIAWPLTWIIMQRWLDHFAFKAPFAWWIYLLTLVISVLIAFVTVAWQSIKSSLQNPVESLRYE